MGQIILALAFVRYPISFEVIGSYEEVSVVLACAKTDASQVYDQLTAFAPECVIDQTSHYLAQRIFDVGADSTGAGANSDITIIDFALEHEVMIPLHRDKSGWTKPLCGRSYSGAGIF